MKRLVQKYDFDHFKENQWFLANNLPLEFLQQRKKEYIEEQFYKISIEIEIDALRPEAKKKLKELSIG